MVVLIYGLPGVGKTTIVKQLLATTSWSCQKPFWHYHTSHGIVVGNYEPDGSNPFLGTDKLSMSIQPKAVEFIKQYREHNFIIEGDRLFNASFINALRDEQVEVKIVFIEATDANITARRIIRGISQSTKFLRSRVTKISNIKAVFDYQIIYNNLDGITENCVCDLLSIIGGSKLNLTHKSQTTLL